MDVADVVEIAPSETVHAAEVKGTGLAVVVPSSLTGKPVSSSNSETVRSKSSRFDVCGRSTGKAYMDHNLMYQEPRMNGDTVLAAVPLPPEATEIPVVDELVVVGPGPTGTLPLPDP